MSFILMWHLETEFKILIKYKLSNKNIFQFDQTQNPQVLIVNSILTDTFQNKQISKVWIIRHVTLF